MQKRQFWGLVVGWVLGFLISAAPAQAEVLFRTGGIMDARNVTAGQAGWSGSVSAKSLDEIEFRVFVENIGTSESPDVNVRAGFALDSGMTLKNRIYLGVWSAPQATGLVEVKVDDDASQRLVYVSGKSVKYGGGCDGCSVSDNLAKAPGAYVGKVKPGEKIEVRFRAQVTNNQTVITGSAAVTPTPGSSSATSSAVAKTNPKTGFTDPIWIRTMIWLGVGIAGIGLRQIAAKMSRIEA